MGKHQRKTFEHLKTNLSGLYAVDMLISVFIFGKKKCCSQFLKKLTYTRGPKNVFPQIQLLEQ